MNRDPPSLSPPFSRSLFSPFFLSIFFQGWGLDEEGGETRRGFPFVTHTGLSDQVTSEAAQFLLISECLSGVQTCAAI